MSSFSLRDKQIRMALDYDRDIAEQAYNMSKKWIKQFNETYLAPNRQEKAVAFEIDNYFVKLQNAADVVLDSYYSSRDEQPTTEIVKIYNSLVAYLNQYVARNPLNQRDWSIIEDKMDLISVPIGKISAIADANGWRGRETMATLIDLLEYRNYISLDNNSLKRIPLDGQKFQAPAVRFDNPLVPQENVYVPPRGAEMEASTPQIDTKSINKYISGLTVAKFSALLNDLPDEILRPLMVKLDQKKVFKEKQKVMREEAKDLALAEILMNRIQQETPQPSASAYPPPQTEADFEKLRREEQLNADWEAFLAADQLGAAFGPPPPEEEEGSGRRRTKKHGKGTPEGILGGLPGGMRNALALRPIDRRPLNLDNEMPDDEFDLSLPMRMQFLTNTEHYRLYDDDEPVLNSQSQYKKLKKRLAKLRDVV